MQVIESVFSPYLSSNDNKDVSAIDGSATFVSVASRIRNDFEPTSQRASSQDEEEAGAGSHQNVQRRSELSSVPEELIASDH